MILSAEDLVGKLKDILNKSKKEEARRIVLNAETISALRKINVMDIFENYVKYTKARGKKPNEYIVYILKNKERKTKAELYKPILDKDAIQLLRLGEEQGVGTSNILKEYFETSAIINKGMNRIKGAITKPMVVYALTSLIGFYILNMVAKQMGQIGIKLNMHLFNVLQSIYWPLIIAVGLAVYIPLTKLPQKIPKLREAYNAINGYKYGNVILFFLSLGLSVNDIDQSLRKTVKNYKPKKRGFEGLAEFLEQYFDEVEIASIKLGIELNQFDAILRSIVDEKKTTFDKVIDQASAFLGEILTFLTLIPVVIIMLGIYQMTISIVGMLGTVGG